MSFKTEDQVRDELAKITKINIGQLTTLTKIFENTKWNVKSNLKPDGWYLDEENDVIILAEVKSSNKKIDEAINDLKKYTNIIKKVSNKIISIAFNYKEVTIFKNNEKLDLNSLEHRDFYINMFKSLKIDKQKIYNLTKSINDLLHFNFKIKNLNHRMIFTACAIVAKNYNCVFSNDMDGDLLKVSILSTIEKQLSKDLKKNLKLNLLVDIYKVIVSNSPDSKSIREFILNIEEIAKYVKSDLWNGEDVMAIFFNEFTRYKGKSENGQVFTPDHITGFMYKLTDIGINDRILDAACGSGSFLIKTMCNMIKNVGGWNTRKSTEILDNQIFGIENDKEIFALACANMLIHKDGKTNLAFLDSKSKEAASWIKKHNINKVLMNPPYEKKSKPFKIIANVLDNVSYGATCNFLLPNNKLRTNESATRELLKKHRLTKIIMLPDIFAGSANTGRVSCFIFEAHKPQNKEKVFACNIEDDGLVTVKNQGRHDIYNKWPDIENKWINIIFTKQKNDKTKWINTDNELEYVIEKEEVQFNEFDFIKNVFNWKILNNSKLKNKLDCIDKLELLLNFSKNN